LNRVNYLKSQAELEAEQIKREEKEKELTISNQEKSLQSSRPKFTNTELVALWPRLIPDRMTTWSRMRRNNFVLNEG